ncbi:MAG: UvrB/UvrC motif-containing protein [Clostridiales bacterium]|nr:UvrB/UvrC motif-containing protein [Clostridiales bacterium]MCF8023849.1 UvrB/UvrC motif-containing protein [Clostridiales bacterium]
MLCERCQKKEATVFYTEIINGQKKQLNLCEECAKELHSQGFDFMPQLNFHNFLGSILGHNISNFTKTSLGANKCEVCGLSEEEFAQKGLLGCGNCYENFGNTLDSLVRSIHGTNIHNGKVPEKTSDRVKYKKEIESLRSQLKQAVAKEQYENAAKIRDSIKEIEKRLEQEG